MLELSCGFTRLGDHGQAVIAEGLVIKTRKGRRLQAAPNRFTAEEEANTLDLPCFQVNTIDIARILSRKNDTVSSVSTRIIFITMLI
jgi:hypothetical protein